jgi:hypothetical protein
LGITLLELALIGSVDVNTLPDVTTLNRDSSEYKLNSILKHLLTQEKYSQGLVDCLKNTLRFDETKRVDFKELNQLVQEKLGAEKYKEILENGV